MNSSQKLSQYLTIKAKKYFDPKYQSFNEREIITSSGKNSHSG